MATYLLNRPNPQAMETLLTTHQVDAVGRIVRLALWAGLMRKEILTLTWADVRLDLGVITLTDRQVPLSPELYDFFLDCPHKGLDLVVTADRHHGAITPQGATHALRTALDEVGESAVRLSDLRNEYIIQALAVASPETVCRWAGLTLLTLQAHFGPYLDTPIRQSKKEKAPLHRQALEELLAQEGDSVAGLALQLAWYGGLAVQEMAVLTWSHCPIELSCAPGAPDAYVIVGPKAGKPLPADRISRLARQALVAGGFDHVTLRDLIGDYRQQASGLSTLRDYLTAQGSATTAQLSQALALPKRTVYQQLQRLCQQGQVVQVGAMYYPPNQVVPPEAQEPMVLAHLEEFGAMYRKDVVELLKVTPNQASVLLQKWVKRGVLQQESQIYRKA